LIRDGNRFAEKIMRHDNVLGRGVPVVRFAFPPRFSPVDSQNVRSAFAPKPMG